MSLGSPPRYCHINRSTNKYTAHKKLKAIRRYPWLILLCCTVPHGHDGGHGVVHLILSVQENINETKNGGKIKSCGGKNNAERKND